MIPVSAIGRELVVGTRSSTLARLQTHVISTALRRATGIPAPREVLLSTGGDRDQRTPLPALGGRGVFTDALERELLAGTIDCAVHSLKDLPVDPTPGLVLAAIGFREDARDVLVSANGRTLDTLPPGARVGTCSVRRSAQLLALRPDLDLQPLRGNVDTRVQKALAGAYDAIVLAAAGLRRLGLASTIAEALPLDRFLPAPGQGALAVQCRANDGATRVHLSALDDPAVRAATDAERAFLEGLGGGCLAPIAAHGIVAGDSLALDGLVASRDGRQVVRVSRRGPVEQARALGLQLADDALAHGARELLA
jgi:hydroxymethylbilane synthase